MRRPFLIAKQEVKVMKFITINPEMMQSVVKPVCQPKRRKTKVKQSFPKSSRQKKHFVLASSRYPNKKKK
jgi:hypothetical protein